MLSLATAWKVARDMGYAWILQRAKFAAQAQLGILERRLPVSDWGFDSGDWLAPQAPHDPEQFKQSLAERRDRFLSFLSPPSLLDGHNVCSQADRVLRGEWPFFSHCWKQVGFPPDWHFNALDQTRTEEHVHWSRIDVNAIHDVKFVWEPNRFAVSFLLVRAYGVQRDERYVEAFWSLVEDWAARNPPNRGANWASGQEAAIRVMAWCFGLYAFLSSPASTPERVFTLARMIAKHGERIAGFIDYALSQRNNHGLSEAVGLFTIGVLFPQFGRAQEWMDIGRELIIRQLGEQIYEDGSYIQHSFNYQRLMLDVILWAFRLGELNDFRFPPECYEQIEKSTQFMLRFCDPETGKMPNYGGNDGSLVLPLTSCNYSDFRPTIQAAYYLTHKQLCFGSGRWNEMTERLFGSEASAAATTHSENQPGEQSEYMKLESRAGCCMLRAARYRDRPAQADQLHIDLWWRGENIACDAGTFLYNGREPWTNVLARTTVHNTVTIDGRDQMTRASRFLWVDWAQAESKSYSLENVGIAVEASHNGYRRMGVVHRRSVLCVADMDACVVVDDLLGKGSRRARLHWLLPDYSFTSQSDQSVLTLQTPAEAFRCHFFSAQQASRSVVRAGELIEGVSHDANTELAIRGWRSLYYGNKEPALSFAIETNGKLPVRFVSVLAPTSTSIERLNDSEVRLCSEEKLVHVVFRPPEENTRVFDIRS